MIVDLVTSEIYGAIIYQDAETVIFWTLPPDCSQARESAISADQLVAPVIFPNEAPGWAILARFQEIDTGLKLTPEAAERRDQLASYAAVNGDQVNVHQPQDQPTGLAALARFGRDLFGGR